MGYEAQPEIRNLHMGKRVPGKYRKRGAVNPIKYAYLYKMKGCIRQVTPASGFDFSSQGAWVR